MRNLRKQDLDSEPSRRLLIALSLACVLTVAGSFLGCSRKSHPPQTGPNVDSAILDTSGGPGGLQMTQIELEGSEFQTGREAQLTTILEIVGGGVGCIDIDLDGFAELIIPNGGTIDSDELSVVGRQSTLWRRTGESGWSSIVDACRLTDSQLYSHGVSTADYNHDGFMDVLLYGFHGLLLFENVGDGTFVDVTNRENLHCNWWVTAATWADLNSDGNLDLYLASYVDWSIATNRICPAPNSLPDVCSPTVYQGVTNQTFLSNGSSGFVHEPNLLRQRVQAKSLGALAARLDADHVVDVYVANDQVENFLFAQGERKDYQEVGLAAGVAVDDRGNVNGSMGVTLLDFNRDGSFDIFVTNFEHELPALYENHGNLLFSHASRKLRLTGDSSRRVAFGVVAADFDHDGDEDVIYTCGHVQYHPDRGSMAQLPVFWSNEAGKQFEAVQPNCDFFHRPTHGRGLATVDWDADGDLDLVATSLNGPAVLIENRIQTKANWLSLNLVGTRCSRTPIGAIVTLQAGEEKYHRQLYGGGSYLSQSQLMLHFAWQGEAVVDLQIDWPDGSSQTLRTSGNQRLTVVQQ